MSQDFPRFKFPLTLLQWPWKRQISPHFEEGTGQSLAWVKSFKPFEPNQQEKFDLCNIGMPPFNCGCTTLFTSVLFRPAVGLRIPAVHQRCCAQIIGSVTIHDLLMFSKNISDWAAIW